MRYQGYWRGRQRNVSLVAGQKAVPPRTLAFMVKQAGLTAAQLDRLVRGEPLT